MPGAAGTRSRRPGPPWRAARPRRRPHRSRRRSARRPPPAAAARPPAGGPARGRSMGRAAAPGPLPPAHEPRPLRAPGAAGRAPGRAGLAPCRGRSARPASSAARLLPLRAAGRAPSSPLRPGGRSPDAGEAAGPRRTAVRGGEGWGGGRSDGKLGTPGGEAGPERKSEGASD